MTKYELGKQTQPITHEDFTEIMDHGFFQRPSHRSFLAFLYWTGVRRQEALNTVKEDFEIKYPYLEIHIPALKHGTRQQLLLPIHIQWMDLILKQVEHTAPTRHVWKFTGRTALNVVKRAMGKKYYPHFFRLNRAVSFLDDPSTTIPEMQAWFGWRNVKTIDNYTGYSRRHLERQANRLKNLEQRP